MKFFLFASLCTLGISATVFGAEHPKPMITGLKNPESVCLGKDGRIYITEIGEFGKDGDGGVTVVVDGKAQPFASGLDDPKGIVALHTNLYLTDKTRVVKVDSQGKVTTIASAAQFPVPPQFLNDIAVEPDSETLYVSDSGDLKGGGGAVFRIPLSTGKPELLVNSKSIPGLNTPNGLLLEGPLNLLLVDFGSGTLYRIKLSDKSVTKMADGMDGGDGLTWDKKGQLYITSWKTGRVFRIPRAGHQPVLLTDKFEQAADSCLDATDGFLLVPDMKAGTLTALPIIE